MGGFFVGTAPALNLCHFLVLTETQAAVVRGSVVVVGVVVVVVGLGVVVVVVVVVVVEMSHLTPVDTHLSACAIIQLQVPHVFGHFIFIQKGLLSHSPARAQKQQSL